MLEILRSTALIYVHNDPPVKAAHERLVAARQNLELRSVEERQSIKIATGRDDDSSGEQLDEARRRLSIRKGTTNAWFLEAAEAARDEVKQCEAAYLAVLAPAKERLLQAGTKQIADFTVQINEGLAPVLELALEIQKVQLAMSEGGCRPPTHPFPSLLPGGLVGYQRDLAKQRGLI